MKKDRKSDFLGRFEEYRADTGRSIAEACKAVGISRSLFYSIRDGESPVSDKMSDRLEDAIDRDVRGVQGSSSYNVEPSLRLEVPRVRESEDLTTAEVRVLLGEIQVRLDVLKDAFSGGSSPRTDEES